MYICIHYVFIFTFALYIYIYCTLPLCDLQLSPPDFLPNHFPQQKNFPAPQNPQQPATSFGIQADGVSGVIHSATRLALQLFLNSERAGKIDKDGGRAGELCSGGWGWNQSHHPPKKKWKKGGGGGSSGEDLVFHHLKKDLFMFFFFFEIFRVFVTEFVLKRMWKIVPPPILFFLPSVTLSRYFNSNSKVPWWFFFINNSSWESGVRWKQNPLMEEGLEFQVEIMRFKCIAGRNTVDGRNPAPVDTVNIQHFLMVSYIPGGAGFLPM